MWRCFSGKVLARDYPANGPEPRKERLALISFYVCRLGICYSAVSTEYFSQKSAAKVSTQIPCDSSLTSRKIAYCFTCVD